MGFGRAILGGGADHGLFCTGPHRKEKFTRIGRRQVEIASSLAVSNDKSAGATQAVHDEKGLIVEIKIDAPPGFCEIHFVNQHLGISLRSRHQKRGKHQPEEGKN